MQKFRLPPLGMRIIKSAVAVALCFGVFYLRGESGIPFYSALAALWCMQPYVKSTWNMAKQRTWGTFLGAALALPVVLLVLEVEKNNWVPNIQLFNFAISSLMLIPLIYLTVLLRKGNASYFTCVVFLSITVAHMSDANPYLFVVNRVLDTLVGIAVGMLVNVFRLPHRYDKQSLFVSVQDSRLSTIEKNFSPYRQVELNRMIEKGVRFTIATTQTPAALLEVMQGIKLKLPVIAMDGAALYDIENNVYIQSLPLREAETEALLQLFEQNNINCFANQLIERTLLIYYKELQNKAEKDTFEKLRKSPYRNYIQGKPYNNQSMLYIMALEETSKIEEIYAQIQKQPYAQNLKVLTYPSEEYAGYSYIKVYDKKSAKENMIEHLKTLTGAPQVVSFEDMSTKNTVFFEKNSTKASLA
ncbi:MAG: HAD hydrolase family protein [Oscillospiraceae bacterium]